MILTTPLDLYYKWLNFDSKYYERLVNLNKGSIILAHQAQLVVMYPDDGGWGHLQWL